MAKRVWGAVFALIAAGLLIVAALSKSWWQRGEGEFKASAGPSGVEQCRGSECKSGDLPSVNSFKTKGTIAMIACLAGGGLAFLASMVAFGKKPNRALGWLALVGGLLALGAGILFLTGIPGQSATKDISWGFFVFLGGGVLAIVAGLLVASWSSSAAVSPYAIPTGAPGATPQARTLMMGDGKGNVVAGPEAATIAPGRGPMSAPMPAAKGGPGLVPPCPRCHGPLQFAAQFKSWFCPRCQQYVST